jgi:O2-independent ubiquinone biosynthesis protein UbiV
MEMTMQERAGSVTLGPVLFNWQPEAWRDFYFRIADEAPVSTVYLGETVCSKRAPLIEPHYQEVTERLTKAGKTVVFSSLSEVVSRLDRKLAEQICSSAGYLVEANDGSALLHLKGRPHCVGPFMNVYNEQAVEFLVANGAKSICLPVEMPAKAIGALCAATRHLVSCARRIPTDWN